MHASADFYAELWLRAADWKGIVLRSGDDVLDLPEFGFRCALPELCRGTRLG